MIEISDDDLKAAAELWLSSKGLRWSEIARSIHPDLTGHQLSRRCTYRKMIPVPRRHYHRCQHCKKVRQVKFFDPNSTAKKNCNSCRDEFTKQRGAEKRLSDDEIKAKRSAWDCDASRKWESKWVIVRTIVCKSLS